ncbi:MAG: dipeptide/oligopeptide/nickel ABC transporter ATP-binding protein [Spirochaetaceae bacterium]|nr:dipeptide/oligopeptide/nickel ABC transporter ATP-binding protein [Spirochaetaceae bacterium]
MSAPQTGESVFSVSEVSFSYHNKRVLENVSVEITRGETLGIAGSSGGGKTTLLMLLLRLAFPQKGGVSFYGNPLREMNRAQIRAFRSKVQPVFQDPFLSLDPSQRVENIITEPLVSLGIARTKAELTERAALALASVGLEKDAATRYPAEFSGGQRQRIAIARALVTEPEVLIADEPVSALDIVTKLEILSLLRSLKEKRNFTLIMVSHDLGVLANLCQRLLVLEGGTIMVSGGAPEALRVLAC